MSFLDVGGGGGDSGGGGKGGGAGDGGGGGGSAANPLGGSPDLTGMGGPGGDMGLGGSPGFDMGMGGGQQNITTPSPSDPSNDPNVGAPQSQNPTPGQSPTSIGGTQSGGGSPLEQLLKGLRAQASPIEAAAAQGQPMYGGGQPGTSTGLQETIPPGTATGLQQQQAGGAERFAPGRPDLSTEPTFSQQPDVHQQQTAGQAQRFAPAGARPDIGAQQTAAGQAARYPSAGAQETAQRIAEGQQAGTAGLAQRYPPEGPPPQAQPPEGPPPKPEAPKTGDTSTAATTAAPPASTGPVSSRGQGPAAQGANPMQIIGDLLRGVLTGDFSGLSRDLQGLAGQPGGQAPGAPATGAPATGAPATGAPAATPPAVGSQAMNSLPGAPDGPSPAADDAQGQRRQEWYQTHDRATPFPEDQFPEQQGPTKEGGVLPNYAGQPQTGQPGNQTTGQQGSSNDYLKQFGGSSTLGGRSQKGDLGKLNPDFGNRLAAAGRAYQQETGQNPAYGEGYRDDATQRIYWNRLQGGRLGPVARPASLGGRGSLHQQGLAMDMPDGGFTRWLQQGNAQRFGLGFPVPNDSNHIQMQNLRGQAYPYTPPPEGQTAAVAGQNTGSTTGANDPYTRQLVQIESSGNRFNRTGSNYGLGQFSPDQFRHFGITDWTNPQQQYRAIAQERAENIPIARNILGRDPTAAELYLMHQQGQTGGANLLRAAQNDPNGLAWRTVGGEGKGDAFAVQKIRGNIPRDNPLRRVPANQVTNAQYVRMWNDRFNRGYQGGDTAQQPQAPQAAQPSPARIRGRDLIGGPTMGSATDFLQDQGFGMTG